MASSGRGLGPRAFTGRLLLWNALAVVTVLLVVAVVTDRVLERFLFDSLGRPVPLQEIHARQRTLRLILVTGFAMATLASLVVVGLLAGRTSRRLTAALRRLGDEATSREESARREGETRDAILSALGEGVALFDAEGRVRYQNEMCNALLGHLETLRSLSPLALREAVEAAQQGSSPRAVEAAVDTSPGEASRILQAEAAPAPGGSLLLVVRDVTEARAVDAIRRDFVANASHELKTPVSSIKALAETVVAVSREDPEQVPRFARQLEVESLRLSRIISDLLDLSRLEGWPEEAGPWRLDSLVREETVRLEERIRESGLTLTVSAEAPAVVRGSPRDLSLLIRNLVENAVQYTRPGGHVDVRLTVQQDVAALEVTDTGLGIPQREQARIFERFYRVDRARSRETGGTGLGLSIVKHVVENLGGDVSVLSRLGEGSTFTVTLPLARQATTRSSEPS